MTMTPPLDLDRLEVLKRAATEGNWVIDDVPVNYFEGRPRTLALWAMQMGRRVLVGEILNRTDGEFMIAARTVLPQLLRLAQAAQAAVDSVCVCYSPSREDERCEVGHGLAVLRAALEGR